MKKKTSIFFRVIGKPQPGGSKNSFLHPKTGKIVTIDACKRNKEWREKVALAFKKEHPAFKKYPKHVPIILDVIFLLPRPRCHFGKGKNKNKLKKTAPTYPTVVPDLTKLVRSTEDALTGLAWHDDASIIFQQSAKQYTNPDADPGALITITFLTNLSK